MDDTAAELVRLADAASGPTYYSDEARDFLLAGTIESAKSLTIGSGRDRSLFLVRNKAGQTMVFRIFHGANSLWFTHLLPALAKQEATIH